MRKLISLLLLVALVIVPYQELTAFPLDAPTITKLSKNSSAPFGLITISGTGFTTAKDMQVLFSNGSYQVAVRPVAVTSKTALVAAVPYYFNPGTGSPAAGAVSVQLRISSTGSTSNKISGFKISNLPTTTAAAGSITEQFLRDLQSMLVDAVSEFSSIKTATNGAINTGTAIARANKMKTQLTPLIKAVVQAKTSTGSYAMTATSMVIDSLDKRALALSDRIILAQLKALKASVGTASLAAAEAGETAPNLRDLETAYLATSSSTKAGNVNRLILGFASIAGGIIAFGTLPAAFAVPAMLVLTANGVFLLVHEAYLYNRAISRSGSGDPSAEAKNARSLYSHAPDMTVITGLTGKVGAILGTIIGAAKDAVKMGSGTLTKALDPANLQKLVDYFAGTNLNGHWQGRYSTSFGSGSLDGTVAQTYTSLRININVEGFGNQSGTGTLLGTRIYIANRQVNGCTILLGGSVLSPNSLGGTFTVSGANCDDTGGETVSGSWSLFRQV